MNTDRTQEHNERLLARLQTSKTLMNSAAGADLQDWITNFIAGGGTLPYLEQIVGEAQRIICSERVNRQIEANLRGQFGEKIENISYLDLIDEYNNFSLSDWFGSNNERFLEWLGLEEAGE